MRRAAGLLALALLVACPEPFDDHTFTGPLDMATFEREAVALSGDRLGLNTLIVPFDDERTREVRMHERGFYEFHDEWYFFRLLNGVPAPGSDTAPVEGLSFETMDEVRAWAREQDELPLDLEWVTFPGQTEERLISDEFYQLAHRALPRRYGATMLQRYDARAEPLFVFRLSFRDEPSYEELVEFFAALEPIVPPEVTLRWLTNNDVQAAIGESMRAQDLPFADRVVLASEL